MGPEQLDKYLTMARELAVKNRHSYLTREHFLYVLLSDPEIREALEFFEIPLGFVTSQLDQYFRTYLERANDDVPDDALAVQTESLTALINSVLLNGMESGRNFPRPIDFVIAMASDPDSFAGTLFKIAHVKVLDIRRWASDHPQARDGRHGGGKSQLIIQMGGDIRPEKLLKLGLKKLLEHQCRKLDDDIENGSRDEETPDDAQVSFGFGGSGDLFERMEGEFGDPEDDGEDGGDGDDEALDGESEDLSFSRIRKFVTCLVQRAREGKIDPVIGRDREIEVCCRALLRRTKSNVLIVGESGVGKTAVVEGLARRIALGDVVSALQNAEIYAIDVPGIVAGTKFRGEMESRLKHILQYVKKCPNAILFIDELQTAASGDHSNGSQDILSLLKPDLAHGNIRLIGTTTYDDYRRSIAVDGALVRRFHKLDLEEPSPSMTREIIGELQSHYAQFHGVSYTPEALDAAVALAAKHLPGKRFPDKAIDIIDEAGAANRMAPVGEQVDAIGVNEIERVVASIARIPDLHVSEDEGSLLKDAQTRLQAMVFGQDQAIEALVRLVKLSRAGIRSPNKPVASLLFAGPTGVGKTEVSRQLAKILNLPFVRFDMSEYREEYSVSKLIGSAPGYVGFDRGGLLTEAIRSKPNCVLLLDEIEKAHSAIYDLLLQVMDAATLTDNTGKQADFRNVILIMTSNSGSADMSKIRIGFGGGIDISQGLREIEKTFAPEFRNRLDDIILFNPLTPSVMSQIAGRMVGELGAQLAEKNIALYLCPESGAWLAEHGYDEKFGARPMQRLIQNEISVPLSEAILFGALKNGGEVRIALNKDASHLYLDIKASRI